MKKRRYAQLMAELHDPSIMGAPPTPPQSESSDNNSDMESDGDLDITSKHNGGDEKPLKFARTIINSDEDSDSMLAKVRKLTIFNVLNTDIDIVSRTKRKQRYLIINFCSCW